MVVKIVLATVGILLFLTGIVPFTPLIWLLVFYHGPAPFSFKLQFWQTQSIGAAVALIGLLLICLAIRRGQSKDAR